MAKNKRFTELLIFKSVDLLVSLSPRKLCLTAGRLFGRAVYRLDKRHRSLALSNLQTAFGSELSDAERKKCAKSAFENFGAVFLDMIKMYHLPREKIEKTFMVHGEENLHTALQQGKGVLIFTAHFGNWEIGPLYLSRFEKLHVIARPLDNRFLEKELLKIRNKFGANVIYKHKATREIFRALHAKEMVAILIDQNVLRDQAVFVDFFGRKAATTPGLASLYLKTRAPLLPMFGYPSPSGTYLIKVLKPLEISPSGDHSRDVLKITQLCTNIIEDQIRQFRHCWFWFHDRWKTRPEGEKDDREK
jgi:KDO2-lipid IV(A) lauroyltransferase